MPDGPPRTAGKRHKNTGFPERKKPRVSVFPDYNFFINPPALCFMRLNHNTFSAHSSTYFTYFSLFFPLFITNSQNSYFLRDDGTFRRDSRKNGISGLKSFYDPFTSDTPPIFRRQKREFIPGPPFKTPPATQTTDRTLQPMYLIISTYPTITATGSR